jgi:NTP pyrophosphatase (non-canonical NTP hydrolase)
MIIMATRTLENFRGAVKDLDEYQKLSERTLDTTLEWRDAIQNYTLGLAGEAAGEVVDIIKKGLYHGHEMSQDDLCEELGDVLFYLAAIATVSQLKLSDIATMNVRKLKARYPDGFDRERSVNREAYKKELV